MKANRNVYTSDWLANVRTYQWTWKVQVGTCTLIQFIQFGYFECHWRRFARRFGCEMSTLSNGLAVSRSEPHQNGSLLDRINAISISQFRCLHFSNELASTLSDRLHSYEPYCYRVQLNYFMKFIEFDSLMHRVSSTLEFRITKKSWGIAFECISRWFGFRTSDSVR